MADHDLQDPVVMNSRTMIRRGSKSFAVAARLFDPLTREGAYMLYAWCRYCDDQIDGQQLGHGASAVPETDARVRLAHLQRETHRALQAQTVSDPVFVAFQRVVLRHGIPPRYPLELLEGFAMDVRGTRYGEFADTLRYCYHVAGVVGVMMAYVMGARGEETLNRAADLGIALQLTNIARDVFDDAEMGRVYLPSQWLEEAGVPPTELLARQHRPAVFGVVNRLLQEAERYYRSGRQGLASLPLRSAWAVATARGVYREIGHTVLSRGPQAWDTRVIVNRRRKLYRAILASAEALGAVSIGRVKVPSPRVGLWTKPEAP